jgi:choline kinase
MKAIILAAGMGSRLGDLTKHKPKCLVTLWGESLLERQLRQLNEVGIQDTLIVAGYQSEKIKAIWSNIAINPEFKTTNMVYSLTFALSWLHSFSDEEVLILYADIAYNTRHLKLLLDHQSHYPVTVLGNTLWWDLWQQRMANPLDDAETFKYGKDGKLLEIGKKTTNINDIMAQYMGMLKIKRQLLTQSLINYRGALSQAQIDKNQADKNMYMTDFLQSLIAKGMVCTQLIDGQWIELDTIEDYALYSNKTPASFGVD